MAQAAGSSAPSPLCTHTAVASLPPDTMGHLPHGAARAYYGLRHGHGLAGEREREGEKRKARNLARVFPWSRTPAFFCNFFHQQSCRGPLPHGRSRTLILASFVDFLRTVPARGPMHGP